MFVVRMAKETPTLGLKANWKQFTLLVVVNAFVGGMVGLERSIFPAFAAQTFGLTAASAILSFIMAFGLSKAAANYFAGKLANVWGRRKVLILGWLLALPVPILLINAGSWSWVVFANVLLGFSQGLTWSSTVVMKIDLVGGWYHRFRRGLHRQSLWNHALPILFGVGDCCAGVVVFGVLGERHAGTFGCRITGIDRAHDASYFLGDNGQKQDFEFGYAGGICQQPERWNDLGFVAHLVGFDVVQPRKNGHHQRHLSGGLGVGTVIHGFTLRPIQQKEDVILGDVHSGHRDIVVDLGDGFLGDGGVIGAIGFGNGIGLPHFFIDHSIGHRTGSTRRELGGVSLMARFGLCGWCADFWSHCRPLGLGGRHCCHWTCHIGFGDGDCFENA
ncbi:MAG: hypothetical protein RI977_1510 [Bacteroidota bacterium]